jgi:hypothetical protein
MVAAIAEIGASPTVIVPAGTVETVPAYLNGTAQEGGLAQCQQHDDCGHAGVLEINFDLSGPAALAGTLQLPSALTLAIANPIGLSNLEVGWWVPAGNVTTEVGGVTFESSGLSGNVDLGALQLGLAGANNIVPGGSWTLCFVNWGSTPVHVTVGLAVTGTPR